MIAHLTGLLRLKSLESCVIDVGGVGYEVFVPLTTLSQFPKEGEKVSVFIHTTVREDAFLLYGFASERERKAFRLLISVSGIGPRLGLAILSIAAEDLVRAISTADFARLSSIPGIGKKTAERLVVELKDKIAKTFTVSPEASEAPQEGVDDLTSALINLGYKETASKVAARKVSKEHAGAPFATQIREALRVLRG